MTSRSNTCLSAAIRSQMRRRLIGGTSLIVVLGLALTGISTLAPAVTAADEVVSDGVGLGAWAENGRDGRIVLQLVKGDAPAPGANLSGVVTTDTNCDPDAQGLSHCHNVIAFADGRSLEFIHTHAIADHPCLATQQRVILAMLGPGWAVATVVDGKRTGQRTRMRFTQL